MDLSFLPAVNAVLNATAGVLLVRGRRLARAHRIDAHRRTMLAAFAVSSLFLLLYLVHKASRGFENTTFNATGAARTAYLVLLASHVTLAMTVPPLAIALVTLGLRGRIARHRRLARWAWPVWMYVSVTGVVIYVLLYLLNPAPARSEVRAPAASPWPSDSRAIPGHWPGRERLEDSPGGCYYPAAPNQCERMRTRAVFDRAAFEVVRGAHGGEAETTTAALRRPDPRFGDPVANRPDPDGLEPD